MFTIFSFFALILALFVLAKCVTILVSGKIWMKFARGVWKSPRIVGISAAILSLIVLYSLLKELTIVQIFAVMLFVFLISAATIAPYSKEFLSFGEKLLAKKAVKNYWPELIVWIVLALWVLKEIFV